MKKECAECGEVKIIKFWCYECGSLYCKKCADKTFWTGCLSPAYEPPELEPYKKLPYKTISLFRYGRTFYMKYEFTPKLIDYSNINNYFAI